MTKPTANCSIQPCGRACSGTKSHENNAHLLILWLLCRCSCGIRPYIMYSIFSHLICKGAVLWVCCRLGWCWRSGGGVEDEFTQEHEGSGCVGVQVGEISHAGGVCCSPCVCVCVRVCVRTCVCVCTCLYTRVCTHLCVSEQPCTDLHVCTFNGHLSKTEAVDELGKQTSRFRDVLPLCVWLHFWACACAWMTCVHVQCVTFFENWG